VACPADIVFAVDIPGATALLTMQLFLSKLVSRLDIDGGKTRVGLVTFATNVGTAFSLTDHSSLESIHSAIWSLSNTGGSDTNTAAALDYVRTTMMTEAAGDRDNVHNIVVVITDGKSSNFNATMVSIEFVLLFIAQWCGGWTLKKSDRNRIESFEMWCWRKMLGISSKAHRTNISILEEIGLVRELMGKVARMKLQYFGHVVGASAGNVALTVLEGSVNGLRHQGRPRRQWMDDIEEWSGCSYIQLKEMSQEREQ